MYSRTNQGRALTSHSRDKYVGAAQPSICMRTPDPIVLFVFVCAIFATELFVQHGCMWAFKFGPTAVKTLLFIALCFVYATAKVCTSMEYRIVADLHSTYAQDTLLDLLNTAGHAEYSNSQAAP